MTEHIEYRDDHDIDIAQLAALRLSAGWREFTAEELAAQVQGARWVVSAWRGKQLIGFARAISDGVTNGYISTVVVDAAYRKRGIGRQLIERLMAGRDSIRWVLHARPHVADFYAKLGFERNPDLYWRDRRTPG